MIRLFKKEAFKDFENKPNAPDFPGNGDILLQPSECYYEAELNGDWQVVMTHPLDPEGRYTYIAEDDVLGVDVRVAREQTFLTQFFRILTVRPKNNAIEVIAKPVAWETLYETPIDFANVRYETPAGYLDVVTRSRVNTRKYTFDLQYNDTSEHSLILQNTNMQEILNGDQEGSFKTLYGTELVYDNYTYHIMPNLGIGNGVSNYSDFQIRQGLNLSGIDVEISTENMLTRIYPTSYEGYEIRANNGHVDIDTKPREQGGIMKSHPFPYSKSICYDTIKFIDIPEESDNGNAESEPLTETQKATKEAMGKITAMVASLSKEYLMKARNGEWDYNGKFADMDARSNNPHDPDKPYNIGADRKHLPYGYVFYSYNDSMTALLDKVIHADFEETSDDWSGGIIDDEISSVNHESSGSGIDGDDIWNGGSGDAPEYQIITDENEKTMIQKAIQAGFKWCETADISEWDWRYTAEYTSSEHPNYEFLNGYSWIEDENGWFFGDGNGHFIQNGWVEKNKTTHYWCGEDGYWDEQYDDNEPWQWWSEGEKWWYGNKNADGTTKNYAREQYIQDTETRQWYWFNGSGWFVEPENKKWWYGTKDGADIVQYRYHQVGNHIWWFDFEGYIASTLTYLDNYEWREDDNGKYYGDGCGHWFANAWVEDSSTSHRWIGADGYEDEDKKDSEEWTWHGSWENGWWYGNDEDDEEEEEEEDDSSSSNNTSDDTKTTLKNIRTICNNGDNYTRDTFISAVEDELDNVSYSSASSLGQIDTCIHAGYNKTYMINQIDGIINSSGYDFDTDDSSDDNSTSPSGNTNSSTSNAHNYVKNQFLYITENKTWYWFDEQGYMTAAWLSDADWEWHQDSKGWYYGDDKGSYPTGQWMKINSKWYFFDMSGYADETTDDFEDSKTEDSNSASYDSNREGIGTVSEQSDVEDVYYDDSRDGVRAWIQNDFVRDVYTCVMEQHENLYSLMEALLEEAADNDLQALSEPAVSIDIDFVSLEGTKFYEQFKYLGELYLGDHVFYQHDVSGYSGIQRVTSIKKDCITGKILDVRFENETFSKKGKSLIPYLSKSSGTLGKIITYVPEEAIEDGYGGFIKTGYGVDLTTL